MVDDDRRGRPSVTRTNEKIARVAALLKEHRRITCRLAAEKVIISKSIVQRISKEDLGKQKICYWFISDALTSEQ